MSISLPHLQMQCQITYPLASRFFVGYKAVRRPKTLPEISLGIGDHLPTTNCNLIMIGTVSAVRHRLIATVYTQIHIDCANHHPVLGLIVMSYTIHVGETHFDPLLLSNTLPKVGK